MKKTEIGEITRVAWSIRKEAAKKWNCKVSEITWRDCILQAIHDIQGNQPMTWKQWFAHYQDNTKKYDYILYHNNILQKNGKRSDSQEREAKETSMYYQILHSEEEDVKQLALLKVMEYFERKGTIPFKYRYSLYALQALNAIKQHSRMLKRSRLAINPSDAILHTGYADTGEKIILTDDSQKISEFIFKQDIKTCLSDRQQKIVDCYLQGYSKQETADIIGISRQALNSHDHKIKDMLLRQGIVTQTA